MLQEKRNKKKSMEHITYLFDTSRRRKKEGLANEIHKKYKIGN